MIEKHPSPKHRLEEGEILAEKIGVSAMIDLSDGLASDLKRICEESKCGARIYLNKIPLSYGLRRLKKSINKNILDYALFGGEDYELLFTIEEKKVPQLQKRWKKMKIPITNIGEILDKRHGIILVSHGGKEKTLSKRGYEHF
jgi:thiamine-monophosphate kinase